MSKQQTPLTLAELEKGLTTLALAVSDVQQRELRLQAVINELQDTLAQAAKNESAIAKELFVILTRLEALEARHGNP